MKFTNNPLAIIFISILGVFVISRLLSYFVLVNPVLPTSTFLTIGGFRLHHFVYGNILILFTSFAVIGLGYKPDTLIYFLYGIGLGLVLDEFPHWMGSLKELNRNVLIIPGGLVAVMLSLVAIGTLILMIKNE